MKNKLLVNLAALGESTGATESYKPASKKWKSDPQTVDRIIEESRQKQAAKEARRAARWSTSGI